MPQYPKILEGLTVSISPELVRSHHIRSSYFFNFVLSNLLGILSILRDLTASVVLSVADASQPSVPLDTNTCTTVVVLAGVVYFAGLGHCLTRFPLQLVPYAEK